MSKTEDTIIAALRRAGVPEHCATIAKSCGYSVQTVIDGMAELVERGIVKETCTGNQAWYALVDDD